MSCRITDYIQRLFWSVTVSALLVASGPRVLADDLKLTDQMITDKIEDELLFDEGVTPYRVDVNTIEGVVTLSGTVNNILSKERAATIAEMVKGVRSVVNGIQVRPSRAVSDANLKAEVQAALARDPATDSYEITVETKDGVVGLRGSVDSFQEYYLCGTVAKGVAGVRALKNEIDISYKSDRDDSEIEKELEQALHWNVLVDDSLINLEVDDGHVTLSGSVGSAAEKSEARRNCWVAGVRSIDDSGLNVVGWLRDEKMRVNKYTIRTADEIRDAIKDALIYDPRTYSLNVNVDVAGSLVTLRGTVDNLKAKRAAEQVARNTVGVNYVSNRLKVRTEEDPSNDDKMQAMIRRALENDPWVDRHEIVVSVYDGQVYLSGWVDNYFERSRAEDLASRTRGVVNVRNHLKVSDGTPFAFDPYLDDFQYDSRRYDHEPDYTLTTDGELEKAVKRELYWSPFVNEDDVDVEVNGRRVILTGTVGSPSERRHAEMNAWQAGAQWVENKLEWE